MSGSQKTIGQVHVIFTEEGIPGWFGREPVPGSTPLDLEELRPLLPVGAADTALLTLWRNLLITHCRIDGRWSPRVPAEEQKADGEAGIADPEAQDAEPGPGVTVDEGSEGEE